MVPIPEHIKEFAIFQSKKRTTVSFSLRCSCGGERFSIVENCLTKEEKDLCKPYYDALDRVFLERDFGLTYTVGENGDGHYWQLLSKDGTQRREIVVPKKPLCAGITVIKAVCPACGREIPVFDSRKNGYDGMTSTDEAALRYEPQLRQKGKKCYQLLLTVENEPSLEEFQEATGEQCSFEFYSDAYSWLKIDGIDENGRKRKLYDIETA